MATDHWVFTFGYGHKHPETGDPLDDHCIRFEGSYEVARAKMVERFGAKWAFQYASDPGLVGVIMHVNAGNAARAESKV